MAARTPLSVATATAFIGQLARSIRGSSGGSARMAMMRTLCKDCGETWNLDDRWNLDKPSYLTMDGRWFRDVWKGPYGKLSNVSLYTLSDLEYYLIEPCDADAAECSLVEVYKHCATLRALTAKQEPA